MSRICIIGVGYVGLVTGACFADLGNEVCCLDVDEERVNLLKSGVLPIYEAGLDEIVKRNVAAGRLRFTTDYADALNGPEFAFITVGTPSGKVGEADLSYVKESAIGIATYLSGPLIVATKSTVPVGTGDRVEQTILKHRTQDYPFAVVSNPEFLREGSAVRDFMERDRIVVGCRDKEAAWAVARLYGGLNLRVIVVDRRTAEMIKYASNSFLATKISFINEMSVICEALGADVKGVAVGMGTDRRIGAEFLEAGLGFGGSCFPKDVLALEHMASVHGCHPKLLPAVMDINHYQRLRVVQKVRGLLGSLTDKTIGILGLAFKPNTDDIRDSASIHVINSLLYEDATIRTYDPIAMDNAKRVLKKVIFCDNAYEVCEGVDALVIATDWNEFKHLDLDAVKAAMKQPIIIDGRNIYDPDLLKEKGFIYYGIGRGDT